MIDRATIDKIMDAANIVDVVSEFVSLRKSGANYKGLCPFHNEKTPSFYVSPARGICKCFSCGKGGNAVNFIMEHEQMTYPESLRWLANKYHIEIHERELSDDEKREQNERESMFIVNEWAASYFHDILLNNVDGRAIGMQYFRSRGFRDDIINRFQLGFCLNDRNAMAKTALSKGYQEDFLLKTGLCYRRDDGQLIDRFAGRAIFPWIGLSGKILAFGGRVLDARTKGVNQKYVNSPDSDIYHKERELYGIFQAKKAIAKEDRVYMVEGYTDVISMHQCGLQNVVANSGTALSLHQIRMLHRFTSNITLLYDGDAAGIHAAMRGTDMLLSEGMNVKILLLPDGEDPDSFAQRNTAQSFKQYIEDHQTDFIEFKTHLLLQGVTDPVKRSEAISSIVKSVAVIHDHVVRATYIHDCAMRFNIKEETLISTMNRYIHSTIEEKEKTRNREQHANTTPQLLIEVDKSQRQTREVEQMLIQMVIRHGEKIIFRNIETEDGGSIDLSVAQYIDYDLSSDNLAFQNPIYNRILREAVEGCKHADFTALSYFTRHPDIEVNQTACNLGMEPFQLSESRQIQQDETRLREQVQHLILDYRRDYVEKQLNALQQQITLHANDSEKMATLLPEYTQLQKMRNLLAKKLGTNIIL